VDELWAPQGVGEGGVIDGRLIEKEMFNVVVGIVSGVKC
jgi:hypothetical protein